MDLRQTLQNLRKTVSARESGRQQPRRLEFERLNKRSMLAVDADFIACTGGIAWQEGEGIVWISGDTNANTFTIAVMGGNIQVNVPGVGDILGTGTAVGLVKGVYAELGGGGDTLNMSAMTTGNGFSAPETDGSCTLLDGTPVAAYADGMATVLGGDGNDTIIGSAFDDSITGGNDRDSILGGNGNDVIYGDLGVDDGDTSGERDTIYGGAGNDSIYGQGAPDIISGEAGNDYIGGGDEGAPWVGVGDTISGGNDNDSIFGGDGADSIYGDAGNDFIRGEGGSDSLWGNSGDDSILGDGALDYMYGQNGNDRIGGDSSDFGWGGEEAGDNDLIWAPLGNPAEFEGEETRPSNLPTHAEHV